MTPVWRVFTQPSVTKSPVFLYTSVSPLNVTWNTHTKALDMGKKMKSKPLTCYIIILVYLFAKPGRRQVI